MMKFLLRLLSWKARTKDLDELANSRFCDVLSCNLRKEMFNRRSKCREIRIYLLSLMAYRKNLKEREDKLYQLYLSTYENR